MVILIGILGSIIGLVLLVVLLLTFWMFLATLSDGEIPWDDGLLLGYCRGLYVCV